VLFHSDRYWQGDRGDVSGLELSGFLHHLMQSVYALIVFIFFLPAIWSMHAYKISTVPNVSAGS
jgi:hypothetical protein